MNHIRLKKGYENTPLNAKQVEALQNVIDHLTRSMLAFANTAATCEKPSHGGTVVDEIALKYVMQLSATIMGLGRLAKRGPQATIDDVMAELSPLAVDCAFNGTGIVWMLDAYPVEMCSDDPGLYEYDLCVWRPTDESRRKREAREDALFDRLVAERRAQAQAEAVAA